MHDPDETVSTTPSFSHSEASVLFLRKPSRPTTRTRQALSSLSRFVFGTLAYSIAWTACILFEVKDAAHRAAETDTTGSHLHEASSR